MILSIDEARRLLERSMVAVGHTDDEADIIADHLIDCELRGLSFGGLARALSIIERIQATTEPRRPITVVKETPVSAAIDGGDQVGYLVGRIATDLAIQKAQESGIACIGAYESWYTGMFSYYLEAITKQGLVGMAAGSGGHIVAPFGGTEGRFATNPIAFGFPSTGDPVIWDIGTSSITLAEVFLAGRLGEQLPEGRAFDGAGAPTRDPMAALGGAFTVWGGHKGSGLAVVIQLLGMMCGAAMKPDGLRDVGFFLLVVNPGLLTSADDYPRRVAEYADLLRSTRPVDPDQPVRVPFERSASVRAVRLATGTIEVDDTVHAQLADIASAAT
ncbi:MAG: Ldh family oxidoreductase [Actinomycetota bacterium]|nr:Ldh family oxidoreductase [Actinomycetota bacterium]